METITDGKT